MEVLGKRRIRSSSSAGCDFAHGSHEVGDLICLLVLRGLGARLCAEAKYRSLGHTKESQTALARSIMRALSHAAAFLAKARGPAGTHPRITKARSHRSNHRDTITPANMFGPTLTPSSGASDLDRSQFAIIARVIITSVHLNPSNRIEFGSPPRPSSCFQTTSSLRTPPPPSCLPTRPLI